MKNLINTTGGEDRDMDTLIGLSDALKDAAQSALDTIVRLDAIIEEKSDLIKELEDRIKELEREGENLRDQIAEWRS